MNAEDFCAWLLRTGLSKRAAARALGVSESYVRAMATGVRTIPDSIARACDGEPVGAAPAPFSIANATWTNTGAAGTSCPDGPDEQQMPATGNAPDAGVTADLRARVELLEEAMPPALEARLNALEAAMAALERRLERPVRVLQQRVTELSMAFEEAGLPLRQGLAPMTDEEAEEAELKILNAQRIDAMQRSAKPASGVAQTQQPSDGSRPWNSYRPPELTPEEEADEMRSRAAAKKRTLDAGEDWE